MPDPQPSESAGSWSWTSQPPLSTVPEAIFGWLEASDDHVFQQYAGEKSGITRTLQIGEARRLFAEHLPVTQPAELRRVLLTLRWLAISSLYFACRRLSGALRILALERAEELSLDPESARILPAADAQLPAWLDRACEWLEALDHCCHHVLSHEEPALYETNPDRRNLAFCGVGLKLLASFSPGEQEILQRQQRALAERFKNRPEWALPGKVASTGQARHWKYPEMDHHIIILWPLVKRHHWPLRELMHLVRDELKRHPQASAEAKAACHSPVLKNPDRFAAYCHNSLGLRKGRRDAGRPSGRLPGLELARRLLRPAPAR